MNARYYTLEEARAVLPQVKELMELAQQARGEILRLRPDAWPALQNARTNGGGKPASELYVHFKQLEDCLQGITDMGIYVKDIDKGLVDFLGTRNEREVFLCWLYGEDDLAFWHELNAGFAGRQPIDEYVR